MEGTVDREVAIMTNVRLGQLAAKVTWMIRPVTLTVGVEAELWL